MKNFTLSKLGITAILAVSATFASAQTFTATQSGNWSDPDTWGGSSAPDYSIDGIGNVVTIPEDITVTLDGNLTISGFIGASLVVDGTLDSESDITMTSGTISGDGDITVDDLTLDGGTFTFTGEVTATDVMASTAITLVADMMVQEMFTISGGTFTVGQEGYFDVAENAVIKISGGTFAVTTGDVGLTNSYDVVYSQGSSASGVEIDGAGLHNVTINVGTANAVTFNSDIEVDGSLILESGNAILNGNDLTINGGLNSTNEGQIVSTEESDITINTPNGTSGVLEFAETGNDVDNFTLNIGENNWITLGSDLTVHGTLTFTSGGINADDHDVVIESAGSITGANKNSYIVTGSNGTLSMQVSSSSTFIMFPVGTTEHYLPAALQMNSGSSASMMEVGVDEGVMSQGTSGTDWSSDSAVVNATWFIEPEETATDVDVNIKLSWSMDSEVNGFDHANAFIAHFNGGEWEMVGNPMAANEMDSMWTIQANNVEEFSPFAVFGAEPMSIDEVENNVVLGLFPNPATEIVNINFNGDIQGVVNMDILNATGQVVANYKVTGNNASIDVSALPSGNYFIRFFNSNFKASKTFVKL